MRHVAKFRQDPWGEWEYLIYRVYPSQRKEVVFISPEGYAFPRAKAKAAERIKRMEASNENL